MARPGQGLLLHRVKLTDGISITKSLDQSTGTALAGELMLQAPRTMQEGHVLHAPNRGFKIGVVRRDQRGDVAVVQQTLQAVPALPIDLPPVCPRTAPNTVDTIQADPVTQFGSRQRIGRVLCNDMNL